jgi:hypothetical protein
MDRFFEWPLRQSRKDAKTRNEKSELARETIPSFFRDAHQQIDTKMDDF